MPTSALALLAMQDRREEPAIVQSLEWIERHATTERSALALSLAALCLAVYGRAVGPVIEALRREGRGWISVDTSKSEVARAALDAGRRTRTSPRLSRKCES